MVFQDRALFPHLTVFDNVAFGLSGRRRERTGRVEELLELTDIAEFRNRYPHELSGGQQQRVALARALAPHPAVMLLDEPFSNLDGTCTHRLLRETRRILRTAGTTAIVVTHSRYEAFSIADRVAILHSGNLEQFGTPAELFHSPHTRTVADFGGAANFVPLLDAEAHRSILGPLSDRLPIVWDSDQEAQCVVVRPTEIELLPVTGNSSRPNGQIVGTRFLGDRQETVVRVTGYPTELVVHSNPAAWTVGSHVTIRVVQDPETPPTTARHHLNGATRL
jgi:iron(III) transport system ATP-binding protein